MLRARSTHLHVYPVENIRTTVPSLGTKICETCRCIWFACMVVNKARQQAKGSEALGASGLLNGAWANVKFNTPELHVPRFRVNSGSVQSHID